MRGRAVAWWGVCLWLEAQCALAAPPHRVLEISGQLGVGHLLAKQDDRSHETESRNGGGTLALGLAYRTRYLLEPWVEVGWAALQWRRELAKLPEYSGKGVSTSSLGTTYFLLGPGVEAHPFRFRVGIGLYHQQIKASFLGTTITPSTWDMGYFLSYGVRGFDGPRYGWGLEAMALLMSESQMAYLGIAFRVWGNVGGGPAQHRP